MIRRAICILLASLSLTACSQIGGLFSHSESEEERQARLAARPTLYCYRTLAKADCYSEPRLGETNRLIGYEAPVPPPRR